MRAKAPAAVAGGGLASWCLGLGYRGGAWTSVFGCTAGLLGVAVAMRSLCCFFFNLPPDVGIGIMWVLQDTCC